MWEQQINEITTGNYQTLARCISVIENDVAGYEELLQQLPPNNIPIIGITGPPGAGKSTIVDALIRLLVDQRKKVAVFCIDPSSPFHRGAVLGDRIRMSEWYNEPAVFIRSLASRGALGGLHPKIIEITDLAKAALFDYIIVETVGVGQSEIEIAGLADCTVVVMVPEAGDEIQTMKSGLMEIADIFVVNKADRPDADSFAKNLRLMLAPAFQSQSHTIPIIKTVALHNGGIKELFHALQEQLQSPRNHDKKSWLMAQKAYLLIVKKRMHNISPEELKQEIDLQLANGTFNLYSFVKNYAI